MGLFAHHFQPGFARWGNIWHNIAIHVGFLYDLSLGGSAIKSGHSDVAGGRTVTSAGRRDACLEFEREISVGQRVFSGSVGCFADNPASHTTGLPSCPTHSLLPKPLCNVWWCFCAMNSEWDCSFLLSLIWPSWFTGRWEPLFFLSLFVCGLSISILTLSVTFALMTCISPYML